MTLPKTSRKPPELAVLTVEEVAAQLGVCRRTVIYHIQENGLPAVKRGKQWLVSRRRLERWKKRVWSNIRRTEA